MNMEQYWYDTGRGRPKYAERNVSQCFFFHHSFHMGCPGIDSNPPREETTLMMKAEIHKTLQEMCLSCL